MKFSDSCVVCGRDLPLTITRIGNRCLSCENAPVTHDEIIELFVTAAEQIFKWYDGDRAIVTDKGYTCPTPIGAHGMTMLRTALLEATRLHNID